jgi:hypothetical protein
MVDSIECRAEIKEKQTGDKIAICCTNDIIMNRQDGRLISAAYQHLYVSSKLQNYLYLSLFTKKHW